MVRFLVLYQRPTDVAAFERHYFGVHVPLAKKLPGLRNYAVSRNNSPVRGPEPYYLVTMLDWDDMASLQRDFASPLGQETGRDVENLEALCPGIRSMILELETA
jgi:uncharacterized protein (TIGR02118 family)